LGGGGEKFAKGKEGKAVELLFDLTKCKHRQLRAGGDVVKTWVGRGTVGKRTSKGRTYDPGRGTQIADLGGGTKGARFAGEFRRGESGRAHR